MLYKITVVIKTVVWRYQIANQKTKIIGNPGCDIYRDAKV